MCGGSHPSFLDRQFSTFDQVLDPLERGTLACDVQWGPPHVFLHLQAARAAFDEAPDDLQLRPIAPHRLAGATPGCLSNGARAAPC
jgi:hypothetical protein